jgi:hypothetical protein
MWPDYTAENIPRTSHVLTYDPWNTMLYDAPVLLALLRFTAQPPETAVQVPALLLTT